MGNGRFVTGILVGWLMAGCQSSPPAPTATGTPAVQATATPATLASTSWYTHLARDGSYSLQFPKAPEKVGETPQSLVLAYPLDKLGSNLSFIQMPLPEDFSPQDPAKLMSKPGLKVVSTKETKIAGRRAFEMEMVTGDSRCWVTMIFERPWLYQLVAYQGGKSPQDYASERQQFFASFQFTRDRP